MTSGDIVGLVIGGLGVIMPMAIVWIVMNAKSQATKEKFSLLRKAVEQGIEIDPELLVDKSAKDNLKMRLLSKLQWGIIFTVVGVLLFVFRYIEIGDEFFSLIACGFLALGLGFLVTYFVGRNDLKHEISLEEKEAEKKIGQ